jgi:DNA invertase Pin-like site-specific DNA recombinase
MTIHPFAPGNRATSITTLAVLAVMTVLIAPSTAACAADGHTAPVLAQGTGMGPHPSARVRVVQHALDGRGYDLGPTGVDGRFGPLTATAVRRMQDDHRLAVDGIVGPDTRKALGLGRNAVRETHTRSHTTHASEAARQPNPTSQQTPRGRLVEDRAMSRAAWLNLGYRGGSRPDLLLAWAFGFLVTLLFASIVGAARLRRDRKQPRTPSRPSMEHELACRSDDRLARTRTLQRVNNGDIEAGASTVAAGVDPPPPGSPPVKRVIGYITISAGLAVGQDDESAAAIEAMCERSGWQLVEMVRDRELGSALERPALGYALERIAHWHADGLVVSDLQRMSRSIVDLGTLMAWFRDAQAVLIALDLGIDTSTLKGHHVASTLITLSNQAHERIAVGGRNGTSEANGGRRTGRPAVRNDPELLERIAAMRSANMTLQAIADQLNNEGVPTLRGGKKWRPSSIQAALGYRRPRARDHLPSLDHRRARASTPAATLSPPGLS